MTVSILVSVTSERLLDELDVDVSVCFSWKLILDTPRFGKRGTGCVIPTDPPETLPGAAEYAMAKSIFKPMNCALAVSYTHLTLPTNREV